MGSKKPKEKTKEQKARQQEAPPIFGPIEPIESQTVKQQKIALAQSAHAPAIIELLKDCRTEMFSVIGDTEFKTLVNTVTLEAETELIRRVVIYLEKIRAGELHEPRE